MTPRLCRTFQTAPTAVPRDDTAKYLRRGFTSAGFEVPDWLVPDVEDGTVPKMKEEADAGLPEGSIEIRVFIKLCPGVYHGGRLRIAFRDVGESAVDGRVRPSEHGTASVPGSLNTAGGQVEGSAACGRERTSPYTHGGHLERPRALRPREDGPGS
jgi:hypothetical protein